MVSYNTYPPLLSAPPEVLGPPQVGYHLKVVQAKRRGLIAKEKMFKGKVHPKNMLVSDVRSDKIGKNAVDHFSLSPLVLKIFAFKVEELLIWRQPF